MAVLLTALYTIVGIAFILYLPPAAIRRHDQGMMLIMSFSMAWGAGIGSVTALWCSSFFQGVHIGMYVGAAAGGLAGRRGGPLQIVNGLVSGLMGGMMGAMLLYMTPAALQLSAICGLALFNAAVWLLLMFAVGNKTL